MTIDNSRSTEHALKTALKQNVIDPEFDTIVLLAVLTSGPKRDQFIGALESARNRIQRSARNGSVHKVDLHLIEKDSRMSGPSGDEKVQIISDFCLYHKPSFLIVGRTDEMIKIPSVSDKLISECKCPVMVIRQPRHSK